MAMLIAQQRMNDYRIVRSSTSNRTLRPSDTRKLHLESVAWIKQELQFCNPARTIVITHHAPSARSEASVHAHSPLSPAFGSNLDTLVAESGVPLWLHGHTHCNVDYQLGSTRVLTNQRGYPSENCLGFDPGMMLEL
jgi:Icc-related predicted phosphoesterase